jgi:hypothetical protein
LLLRRCRYGGWFVGLAASANCVIASLAGKRSLTAGGLVIQRKALELVLLRR